MVRAKFGSWTPGQVTSASQIYVFSTRREIAKHEQLHIGISYFILLPHSQALTNFSSLAVQRAGWEPGNEWFMLKYWCTTSGKTSLASYPGSLTPPALCCTLICKWWKGVAWIEVAQGEAQLAHPLQYRKLWADDCKRKRESSRCYYNQFYCLLHPQLSVSWEMGLQTQCQMQSAKCRVHLP